MRTAFVGCVWLRTSHRMRWWRRRPRSYTSVRSKVSGSPPFQTRFGNWEEVNVAPFRDGDKKRPSSQKPDIERIFPKSDQRENKLSNFGCIIVCFHLKESTRKYAGHVGNQVFNTVHKPIIDYSRFPSVHNERWDEDTSTSFELARLIANTRWHQTPGLLERLLHKSSANLSSTIRWTPANIPWSWTPS